MRDRLWFYGSYRDLSTQIGMEGHQRQRQRRRPGALGLGRLADRRAPRAGPHDDHRPYDGPVRQEPHPLQLRVPAPLRRHAAQCRHRGLPQPRRRLDRPRQQQAPDAVRRKRRRRPGAATSTCRSTSIRAPGRCRRQQAALRGRLHAVPLPADLRPSAAGRHHRPDPVTEQSNAINPATGRRIAPVANYRYRGVESWGPATGKTDDIEASASYVTGAHSMKVGYQYRRSTCSTRTIANQTQLGYRFNQGVPNAVSYYLPDFGRRTITQLHGFFVQDSWTLSRLTLQGALRYDRASSFAPVGAERHARTRRSSTRSRSPSSRRRASMRTTTSRRAWVSPTTCSATARRR